MTPPNLSLIFIMIFFWVTMWLVYRFLIRPIGGTLAERNSRIESANSTWETTNRQYLEATDRLELEGPGRVRFVHILGARRICAHHRERRNLNGVRRTPVNHPRCRSR